MKPLLRGRVACVLASAAIVFAGCASTALKRAQSADELRDDDLAVASYMKALRERPNNADAQQGLERAKLRASETHLFAGRRLESQGRYDEAVLELQVASELNPTNGDAEAELRKVRIALRAQLSRPNGGSTALEALIDRSRDIPPAGYAIPSITIPADISTGTQATTRTVYQTIARLANLSLTFDSQFREAAASVNLRSGMTVKQALDAVASSTTTFYEVIGPNTIVVVPDTPQKRREYTDEVVQQFVVKNADITEAINALRVAGDVRYAVPITATNTIQVRDTAERMPGIGRFLAAFDKASAEVVVDVEILEVNRTTLREYGLQIASPGSPGINGSVDVNQSNGVTLRTLRNLSEADVIMGNIPALYYRLLKTDGRTRTLANPHIRITDNKKVTASFGDRIPVPKTVITPIAQGGVNVQPQTSFDYENIGVNLDITPRTHADDEVTLTLEISLTSLGAPGFDGLPTFGNRDVQTTIRLRDGETNILAGLIRQDERTERETIPGLGSVPILGNIFSRDHKEATQTDVVILLTPHIVRVLDMTEDDLRPLRLPREATGAAIIEPYVPAPPVLAAPPARAPNGPPSGSVIPPITDNNR